MKNNIFKFFKTSNEKYGSRIALVVDNVEYTYNDLTFRAGQIVFILNQFNQERVGIFASRSAPCYEGILGTLASGKTYVPLNPKFPIQRNQTIIGLANLEIFVIDILGLKQILAISDEIKVGSVFICPDIHDQDIPDFFKSKFQVFSSDYIKDNSNSFRDVNEDKYAYIMFTSGSTGTPKGVPISHRNVYSYINYQKNRYDIGPSDRFSQTFDLTFDLSVHDMFLAWSVGASLYIIPEKILMAPAKFIKENKITVWFSVPSLAQFMKKFKMLKENWFPNLRYSLFCGEALPKSIALAWQSAAPNSILENIYGPTEATIGITHYRIPKDPENIFEYSGIVSIGEIFYTQDFCLIDAQNDKVKNFGELCLTGSQLTTGYLNNKEKTEEAFFCFPNDNRLWYKTGDIVKFENNNLLYISRKDFQVKIRGYRIELDEINFEIRNFTKCDLVYTVPFPMDKGGAEKLYSFIDINCAVDKMLIFKHLKEKLPEYMVPKDIFFIKDFPLNSNGKIDLKQLSSKIGANEK